MQLSCFNGKISEICPVCNSKKQRLIQRSGEYLILRCLFCGLFYVNPRPPKEKHSEFHNQEYFYKNYNDSIENFYKTKNSIYQKEIQLKSARLDYISRFLEPAKLLDVGTGQGMFAVIAKGRGWDVSATDISSYVCDFLSREKGIKMFNGYLEEMGLPENNFDVVTFWHVLEHTFDPYTTLLEAKRILRPAGHLFIAVPNTFIIEMYLRKLLKKPHFREDIAEWHFYCFNQNSLTFLLSERLGFKIEGLGFEFYLRSSKIEMAYNVIGKIFLAALGVNICRTILLHATNIK
jgi:2-polyprenyl-3-methyl-5-hydroxy-6-metoxy-1,4-benzoquinol methylase